MKGTVELELGGQRRKIDFEGERLKNALSIAGTWKITISAGDGQLLQPGLKLIQDGEKLEGVYTAGFDGKETPISGATLAGKKLSFQVKREGGGQELTLNYGGEVDGNALRGTLEYALGDRKGTAPFEARRLAQWSIATGTWKLAVTTQSGRSFQPAVKLAEKDGKLGGVYLGELGETPIEDARVAGEKLSFRVMKQRGEQMYILAYRGTLRGDTIKGVVAYSFDGESGTLAFEGRREESSKPESEGDAPHEAKQRAF
jgi:hypothetical protein